MKCLFVCMLHFYWCMLGPKKGSHFPCFIPTVCVSNPQIGCPTNSKVPCGLWVGAPHIVFPGNNKIYLWKKTQDLYMCRCVRSVHVSNLKHWCYQPKKYTMKHQQPAQESQKPHGAEVLSISNTFLYPYPRIAAFDTNGTLSVEVFPRNSGRIWARIATWMNFWCFFFFFKACVWLGPNLLCEFPSKWPLDELLQFTSIVM